MRNTADHLPGLIALRVCPLACNLLWGQTNVYQFNALDSRKGSPNNQVDTFFKDERGFVRFGTASGLKRCDGFNVKLFRYKAGDSASLSDDCAHTVARNRKATFTNLNRGTHTLPIVASNGEDEWINKPLLLTIRVPPPHWLTPYALVA